MRGKKSRGSEAEREGGHVDGLQNSSGQMVMPMPASAMARVGDGVLGLQNQLGLEEVAAEILVHRAAGAVAPLNEDKGHVLEGVDVRPEENCSRISPARSPKISSVKDLGTTIISFSSVRGTTSTPSIMMGWKQTIRSTRPWGQLVLQVGGSCPRTGKNSTMGNSAWNWGRNLRQEGQAAGVGDAHPEDTHVVAVDVAHLGQKLAVQVQDLGGRLHQQGRRRR